MRADLPGRLDEGLIEEMNVRQAFHIDIASWGSSDRWQANRRLACLQRPLATSFF